MGEEGSGWHSPEIRYNDVRVPLKNLIGQEGEGFAIAQQRLGPGRIHHCERLDWYARERSSLMCQRASTRTWITANPHLCILKTSRSFKCGCLNLAEIDAARLLGGLAKQIDELVPMEHENQYLATSSM